VADLEQFSLDKHLVDWSRQQESVTVEGTLLHDGDYYVIDRDPTNPGTLLRIRTTDVLDYQKMRTVSCIGGERQLYRILIKRGVPVECISIIESNRIPVINRHSEKWSETFINYYGQVPANVIIKDHNDNDTVLFNGTLQPFGTPGDRTTQMLVVGEDLSAVAFYWKGDNTVPSRAEFLRDNDEEKM
jgi:hypothetical protein